MMQLSWIHAAEVYEGKKQKLCALAASIGVTALIHPVFP